MSDLIDLAVVAHGGRDRWKSIKKLHAHLSIGGVMWQLKGWPSVFSDVHVSMDPHRQRVEYAPFLRAGHHSIYEPDRTAIQTDVGELLEYRDSPRESFEGHQLTTHWDAQQLIYFSGYAIWTYLTTPFLFEQPGFKTEEIEPWEEEGETWRRLKVSFPSDVHSHCTDQIFYFDASGILRRHDYSVDVMGGTSSANYATEPKTFDGFVFPTKRRVYAIGPDNRPIRERLALNIDVLGIRTE